MIYTKQERPPFYIEDFIGTRVLNALAVLSESTDAKNCGDAVDVIAGVFGAEWNFDLLLDDDMRVRSEHEQRLLASFQNNLNLLVVKTWITQCDEAIREKILFHLKHFVDLIAGCEYTAGYGEFMEILHDTVYLMFGEQALHADFSEYAMRIDPEFGIFWQYVKILESRKTLPANVQTNDSARVMLLLGMLFLANY